MRESPPEPSRRVRSARRPPAGTAGTGSELSLAGRAAVGGRGARLRGGGGRPPHAGAQGNSVAWPRGETRKTLLEAEPPARGRAEGSFATRGAGRRALARARRRRGERAGRGGRREPSQSEARGAGRADALEEPVRAPRTSLRRLRTCSPNITNYGVRERGAPAGSGRSAIKARGGPEAVPGSCSGEQPGQLGDPPGGVRTPRLSSATGCGRGPPGDCSLCAAPTAGGWAPGGESRREGRPAPPR